MEYADKALFMMSVQIPLLLKQSEIDGAKQIEIIKREEFEKTKKAEGNFLSVKRKEDEKLIKTKREEDEKFIRAKGQEEEKMELQKQATKELELKRLRIETKVELKRIAQQDRKDIADIKSQKEEDYRKTLEAQTKARNQRMEEENEIKKRPYTDAFITCTKKSFPDSMCGACARCTARVAHYGSAGILKAENGDFKLFCGKCVPSVKKEKKHLWKFFTYSNHLSEKIWC